MTPDQWVQLLTFSSGLVVLLSTFVSTLPTVQDTTKVVISAGVRCVVLSSAVGDAVTYAL